MGFSKLLVLDSSQVFDSSNPNVTGRGFSDFTVAFNRPIQIPKECYCALIKLNTYYTWSIVNELNNNNKFQIVRTAPAKTVNATLPDGIYSLTTLNDFLYALFVQEFGFTGDSFLMPISLGANQATSRFVIKVNDPNYRIELSPNGSMFYFLLGWDKNSTLVTQTTTAANVGNINFNIDNYLLHCDLVTSSVINNDITSSVIYSFVPSVEIGEAIIEQPIVQIHLPMSTQDVIKSVHLYLTDNKQRYVDLEEAMVITLHLTD